MAKIKILIPVGALCFLFLSRNNVLRSHGVEVMYRVADEIKNKLTKTWISDNDLEQVRKELRVVLFSFDIMRQTNSP